MKWNFECESGWRDYLHDLIIARRIGFCRVNKYAALSIQCGADLFERTHVAQQTTVIAT
jgi:hypothetical protein